MQHISQRLASEIYSCVIVWPEMVKTTKGTLLLIAYSILAGSVVAAVRLMEGVGPMSMLFFRTAIGSLALGSFIVWRKGLKELKPRYIPQTLLTSVLQLGGLVFYFLAILKTTAANATFLNYTAPIFSLLFARLFFKERIEKSTIIGIILTFFGIILLVNPYKVSFTSTQMLGNLYALLGGACYAAMGMSVKAIRTKVSSEYVTFWEYGLIAVVLSFAATQTPLPVLHSNAIGLLYLGIVTCAIAFSLFNAGVKYVPAQKVFIITALEPVIGAILGGMISGEQPTWATLGGVALILGGVFVAVDRKN